MAFLGLIGIGFLAGVIARMFIHTGRQFGCIGTILLGIAGSFMGGLLGSLISDGSLEISTSSWIGSIIGAIVILVVIRFLDGGKRQHH
ncbi:MAG: GlsB/YeaQ/YmgE family stress response membrane protein [Actinomycetota bacterium]